MAFQLGQLISDSLEGLPEPLGLHVDGLLLGLLEPDQLLLLFEQVL